MLKFGIIGLGQAGCNIADYAFTKNFKAIAINTAKIDLDSLKYIPKENRILLNGYDGAGRNRNIGQEAMVENANELLEIIKSKFSDCDNLFIAASGGGGTGSGALPVCIDIAQEVIAYINIIYILPYDMESPYAKINTCDCISQISDNNQIGSVFILDNEKGKKLNLNKPKHEIYKNVNMQIIDILTEINECTSKHSITENFDNRDFLEMLSTRGCTLISKANTISNVMDDNNFSSLIEKSWNENYFSDYNVSDALKVALIGCLNKESLNKINYEKIFNGNIPFDIKDSFYENENIKIYSIFSGLPFPEKRINQIKESVIKIKDDLSKKIENSQTMKVDKINWELKAPSINSKKTNIPLSERLKNFK